MLTLWTCPAQVRLDGVVMFEGCGPARVYHTSLTTSLLFRSWDIKVPNLQLLILYFFKRSTASSNSLNLLVPSCLLLGPCHPINRLNWRWCAYNIRFLRYVERRLNFSAQAPRNKNFRRHEYRALKSKVNTGHGPAPVGSRTFTSSQRQDLT